MIVASIFGTTDGLEVQNLPVGPGLAIKLEDGAVAFASQDVVLKTDRDIFRINRREVSGKSLTWIGLYREATEIVSNRPGGYYGAGLWLYDIVAPGQLVAETLVNLADQIKNLAISGGKFTKRIADIRGSIVPPAQVSQLLTTKKPLVTGISPNSPVNALISNQETAAASTIEWAQVSHSAELFNELLIGHPEQLQPRQGQFQKTTERFDSVVSAIQWAYNKRVIQLDGMLQKQKSELDGASQQLMQLKAEISNKQAECESVRIELSNTRREVQTAWDEKKRGQQQYESELQRLRGQSSSVPQQSVVRRPPAQSPNGQQGAQGVALSHYQERSFFAQNWPLLSLIAVLMIALGVLGFLFQQRDQDVAAKNAEIARANSEVEELKKDKAKVEDDLKNSKKLLEESKQKSESKKAEVKEATPVEWPLIAESNDKNCKTEEFSKFSYVIDESVKSKGRAEIYTAIATACNLDKLKSCEKTISTKIKNVFIKDIEILKGEILLPQSCNGGKQITIKSLGLTLIPIKGEESKEESKADKKADKKEEAKAKTSVISIERSSGLPE